ncbi:hypothetical protein MMC30_003100 [Trapelia coarctata]|nr:hypothetical protein [Trapelia coarctata]
MPPSHPSLEPRFSSSLGHWLPRDIAQMRVLLYQSAKGLFASSGGYKSNLTVIRHLASRGHIVQQVVFAHEFEIQDYCMEEKLKGGKSLSAENACITRAAQME